MSYELTRAVASASPVGCIALVLLSCLVRFAHNQMVNTDSGAAYAMRAYPMHSEAALGASSNDGDMGARFETPCWQRAGGCILDDLASATSALNPEATNIEPPASQLTDLINKQQLDCTHRPTSSNVNHIMCMTKLKLAATPQQPGDWQYPNPNPIPNADADLDVAPQPAASEDDADSYATGGKHNPRLRRVVHNPYRINADEAYRLIGAPWIFSLRSGPRMPIGSMHLFAPESERWPASESEVRSQRRSELMPVVSSLLAQHNRPGVPVDAFGHINRTAADPGEPVEASADDKHRSLECRMRRFAFRAVKTDASGNTCTGLVMANICYGGCETGEIADWVFPHKKSIHKVCTHGARKQRKAVLSDCSADADESLREYQYVDALTCVCQKCVSADTTCLGSLTRPYLVALSAKQPAPALYY